MIAFLIGFALFFLIRNLSFKTAKTPEEKKIANELDEVEETRRRQEAKVCPPHKWRHHEIKDAAGNVIHWKIICDLCGPLGSQDKR